MLMAGFLPSSAIYIALHLTKKILIKNKDADGGFPAL
jgi:hypothetical protein